MDSRLLVRLAPGQLSPMVAGAGAAVYLASVRGGTVGRWKRL